MRALQIITLALLATAGRADTFIITFTATNVTDSFLNPLPLYQGFPFSPNGVGIGHLETDGVCQICYTPNSGGGILDFTAADPQLPFGEPTYRLFDPDIPGFTCCNLTYDRAANTLEGSGTSFSSEVIQIFSDGTYFDDGEGDVLSSGVYTIAQVPEPSALLLMATVVIALGWRRWGHAMNTAARLMGIAVLCLAPLMADTFEIDFTAVSVMIEPDGWTSYQFGHLGFDGSGHFSTDGACGVCSSMNGVADGMLEFTALDFNALGQPTVTPSFDLHSNFDLNQFLGSVSYNRSNNDFSANGVTPNMETLIMGGGSFFEDADGVVFTIGTYTVIGPVPEPSTTLLLATVVVGLGCRRWVS